VEGFEDRFSTLSIDPGFEFSFYSCRLLFGLVVLIAAGMHAGIAVASPAPVASPKRYLGAWNYNQPDQDAPRTLGARQDTARHSP
jgi:hypothetical protein